MIRRDGGGVEGGSGGGGGVGRVGRAKLINCSFVLWLQHKEEEDREEGGGGRGAGNDRSKWIGSSKPVYSSSNRSNCSSSSLG